jgi:hypothetical protein
MTDRSWVTILAMAALLCLPGLRPAGAGEVMAQSAAPLEIPAAPPPQSTVPQAAPPQGSPPAMDQGPPPAMDDENSDSPDNQELSLGDIPIIETVELTPDLAKRALDSYIAAREKYVNSDLEQFENLQDFVDQTEDGKAFEADIKAAGFANVSDWNLAITTLGLTYGSIVDDQTPDLLMQIEEVQQDTEMAQDIKDRMVKALKALIPSDNNRKVVEDLFSDPVYSGKLKLLDIEEE